MNHVYEIIKQISGMVDNICHAASCIDSAAHAILKASKNYLEAKH